MRILIVYDNEGNIIYTLQGGEEVKKRYSCMVAEIGENEIIESINTQTGQVIVKEKDTRVSDIQAYLNNTDDSTISKVEDTILEIESNKIKNGGM
ncbi:MULTISPECIES: hypothetical protein [Clostridium]|uniref:Uncharacterized protein n=5 Tax=Clostridium TaxID=1485 RepID=A0AA86JU88_9CLOT|nr:MULTISPECIES: hypothetical protein [Clostridium]CAG9703842.1 conserved hypothetical protein [Clostridium neonatale]CAI3546930.1 conserved hypothetical protein [Clostridium neonatale]CAI3559476.1 conserved hypothetical protein [Clostridium neonatale]CAI3590755.1 conserved hypothetical protein [Clostridium neonatale]CAI3598605.1 conserved hypothetical protein [Clostridium neonatale]